MLSLGVGPIRVSLLNLSIPSSMTVTLVVLGTRPFGGVLAS